MAEDARRARHARQRRCDGRRQATMRDGRWGSPARVVAGQGGARAGGDRRAWSRSRGGPAV